MKTIVPILSIALLMAGLGGCMTFELETGAFCGTLGKRAGSESETVHGSLYGFQWKDSTVEKCEDGCGLYRVEYHTNALFVLSSVVSLGLYVPQTVEWWCQEEARDDSDTEPFDPNASPESGEGSR